MFVLCHVSISISLCHFSQREKKGLLTILCHISSSFNFNINDNNYNSNLIFIPHLIQGLQLKVLYMQMTKSEYQNITKSEINKNR